MGLISASHCCLLELNPHTHCSTPQHLNLSTKSRYGIEAYVYFIIYYNNYYIYYLHCEFKCVFVVR